MKSFLVIASAAILLTSCNQDELERTNRQKDSLMTVLQQRDGDLNNRKSCINDFIPSFNEYDRNLDSVAARQHLITVDADKSGGDLKASLEAGINFQIGEIQKLMEQNHETTTDLRGK